MKEKNTNDVLIKFLPDCLLAENILVIGDVHIGWDEYSNGALVFPGVLLKQIIKKLDKIFYLLDKEKIKVKKIIQLGDLKHDFGKISKVEWRETIVLLKYFIKKVGKNNVVIIKGNHDIVLGPIVKKLGITLVERFILKTKKNTFVFAHGDRDLIHKNTGMIFLGHLHPAITLSDAYKNEKFKCFLRGLWKGNKVFIVPSFSPFSYGHRLEGKNNKKFFIVPYNHLKNFEVIIYNDDEDKEYIFGKLKKLI